MMAGRWDSFGQARNEQVLTATWTQERGVEVESSDLPDAWLSALGRIGRDLHLCQYGNSIERIDWVAEYEASSGGVLLYSRVTAKGRVPSGWGVSGAIARVVDDEETVAAVNAELVANEVADAGVAWPYREGDGFMSPRLINGVATWTDKGQHHVIGSLSDTPASAHILKHAVRQHK
ncbi:hypothetical protein [Williamsia maris]|uniref:Uncharacterized protein n=1 Tax=Williamsia maris TaxID=72806 RepID=A0ABT1HJK9_9NOCA|nr:hypothetical protein [Williamsia maris]MCP2178127.1 hypothetical protein [Williamsia maris]